MKLSLPWFSLVPLVTLLWGLPVEAVAQFSRHNSFSKESQDFNVTEKPQLFIPFNRDLGKQAAAVKQNGIEQNVLFSVEGTLAGEDARFGDNSLHDIHVFDGQAEQIVRITLNSNEFDTFLILQDASGEELARNDDGSDRTNAEIVFRLPTTEQYRIVAKAYDANGKGAYRLIVEGADERALFRENQKAEADRLLQQGIEAAQLSQYQTALAAWQSALEIYIEIGNRQGEANALGNLGIVYDSLSDYERAIDFHQQSLTIERAIGNRQGEANSLGNLGLAYVSLGEYERSIEFLQQSLAIVGEIGNRHGESLSLGNLSLSYMRLGEYGQAIELQQQHLAIAREIGDRQGEANALGNLGLAYVSLGEYERSIDFSQQSLAIVREIGDRQGEGILLGNLGLAYVNSGEYERSIEFQQESLAIAQEVGDRQNEAISLGNLAIAYGSLDEYERSIDFLQQFLVISQEIGDCLGEANALSNLGSAYDSLGEYERSVEFQQQSLAISREIGDRQGEALALTNSGIAALQQGELHQAETALLESIDIYEALRAPDLTDQSRISFFETQISAYRTLELALVLQNKPEAALEIAERGRTRSFVQLLSEKSSLDSENQVLTASPSFSEIQRIAREQQSTLVEYSLVNNSSGDGLSFYAWVVQPTGELHFKEIPIGDSLTGITDLVAQSRTAMSVRGRGGFEPSTLDTVSNIDELSELYQLLIKPIEEWLPNNPEDRVVFIPQGELFLVPFPALKDESGTYLIERHTLLTAPSIQVLDLTATTANSSATATKPLIVGNPVMPEIWNPDKEVLTQLSPLLGAEAEAEAIASFFETDALLGEHATEQAVKEQINNAQVVHLATHGLLEYGIPEASGVRDVPGAIALTPTDTEDGLLTATEILELDLQADLVVLSACDTGLGTITGDGVIGLSRSLIAAGTPSVIVSLWSIPDAPTAELMVEFYRQRQQGKDKAQALRQAMLITKETHENPRDWAAFTLIGVAE